MVFTTKTINNLFVFIDGDASGLLHCFVDESEHII